NGTIRGNYLSTTQSGGGGFILNSVFTLFQVPGSFRTDALGINNTQSVVGWYLGPSGTQGYIRSSTGTFSTINVLSSLFTEAGGINNSGDIVGWYGDSATGHVLGSYCGRASSAMFYIPKLLTRRRMASMIWVT